MTNAAVPTPPRPSTHGAKGRQCPDDLWKLGERAVTRARRWADESAHEPTPQSAKLLSRILADPDGLTFTTRFVDDVVRPADLDVASAALQKLAQGRKDFLPPALAAAMGLGSTASRLAPRTVTAIARRVFREIVGDLVVDATDKGLGPALARAQAGTASTSTSWARPSSERRKPPTASPRSPASSRARTSTTSPSKSPRSPARTTPGASTRSSPTACTPWRPSTDSHATTGPS